MYIQPEDIIKVLLSLALGGVIGAEREMRDKPAGFRTLMFICVGSTLFTIFSIRFSEFASGPVPGDPARIAAQIVAGIGFLGAGVILREHGEVRGLTTAATIWLVAAIGMGVGGGWYLFTVLTTVIISLVLWVFPSVERMMGTVSQVRYYQVTTVVSLEKYHQLEGLFKRNKLQVISSRRVRHENEMVCYWTVSGKPSNHESMVNALFEDKEISSFEI